MVSPWYGDAKDYVDASVFIGNNYFSIRLVVRNHQGHFIRGKIMRFTGCTSVLEAEAVGVLEALNLTKELSN